MLASFGRALPLLCATALTGSVLVACAPPCKQVCRKTLNCALDSERVAQDECEDSCRRQETLYARWQDDVKAALFDDHKRCIKRSSCDELAEGVCYEGFEDLFVFDPDKELPEVTTADEAGSAAP